MDINKIQELISVACYGDLNAVSELREYLLAASYTELLKLKITLVEIGDVVNMDFSHNSTHPFIMATTIMGIDIKLAL